MTMQDITLHFADDAKVTVRAHIYKGIFGLHKEVDVMGVKIQSADYAITHLASGMKAGYRGLLKEAKEYHTVDYD